ncbi:hypothetical protein [Flammeovirga sp. SubArs3]|uniref:hypothetical protein n=1 Tax=Flammeovirga sp. SubArs3 TaxID=2995316 RepID=UPI00248BC890|nr:hypothetical protein [Flammeovirga sp. SubArs3]
MFFNKKLLKYAALSAVLLSSCNNKVEDELQTITSDMLPTLTLSEMDFLRGEASFEMEVSNEYADLVSVADVKVTSNGADLDIEVSQESDKWQISFDSKQLTDGIHPIKLSASLSSDLTLSQSEITQDFDVEVDNYLPTIFYEAGYIEGLNSNRTVTYFSNIHNGEMREVEQTYSNYQLNFMIVDETGTPLTSYNDAKTSNDSIFFLIPAEIRGRNFYVKEAYSYEFDEVSTELFDNSVTTYKRYDRNIVFNSITSNLDEPLIHTKDEDSSSGTDEDVITKQVVVGVSEEVEAITNYHYSYYNNSETETIDGVVYYTLHLRESNKTESLYSNYPNSAYFYSVYTYAQDDPSEAKGVNIATDFINDGDTILITMDDLVSPKTYSVHYKDNNTYTRLNTMISDGEYQLMYNNAFQREEGEEEDIYYTFDFKNLNSDDFKYIEEKVNRFGDHGFSIVVHHLDDINDKSNSYLNADNLNYSDNGTTASLGVPSFTDVSVDMTMIQTYSKESEGTTSYDYDVIFKTNSNTNRTLSILDYSDEELSDLQGGLFNEFSSLPVEYNYVSYVAQNGRLDDGHFWMTDYYYKNSNARLRGPYSIREMAKQFFYEEDLKQALRQGYKINKN